MGGDSQVMYGLAVVLRDKSAEAIVQADEVMGKDDLFVVRRGMLGGGFIVTDGKAGVSMYQVAFFVDPTQCYMGPDIIL